jgi:hypothetical protein
MFCSAWIFNKNIIIVKQSLQILNFGMLSSYITLMFLKSFIEKLKSNLKSLWYVVHGEVRAKQVSKLQTSEKTKQNRGTSNDMHRPTLSA